MAPGFDPWMGPTIHVSVGMAIPREHAPLTHACMMHATACNVIHRQPQNCPIHRPMRHARCRGAYDGPAKRPRGLDDPPRWYTDGNPAISIKGRQRERESAATFDKRESAAALRDSRTLELSSVASSI